MKAAILAGGRGQRLLEKTQHVPKSLVTIGGQPVLWHIIMNFNAAGFSDFTIALGYKGDLIKRWAVEFAKLSGDLRVSTAQGRVERLSNGPPDVKIDLIETGLDTQTGGRIKRLAPIIGRERFILALADGLTNADFGDVLRFHEMHGRLATMVLVRAPARFGHVEMDGARIASFREKPQDAEGWINSGLLVLEPGVFDYIDGPNTVFERGPLNALARDGELMGYHHLGFWQCMDTLAEQQLLDEMWRDGNAPWATWAADQCTTL